MIIPEGLEELASYVEKGNNIFFFTLQIGVVIVALSNRRCQRSKMIFLGGILLKLIVTNT